MISNSSVYVKIFKWLTVSFFSIWRIVFTWIQPWYPHTLSGWISATRMFWTEYVQKKSLCCTKFYVLQNDLNSLSALSLSKLRSLCQCILIWHCKMLPLSQWNSLCPTGCTRTVKWYIIKYTTIRKSCLLQFLKNTLCLIILSLKLLSSASLNWISGTWSINTASQHSSKTARTLYHQHLTSAVTLLRNTFRLKPRL